MCLYLLYEPRDELSLHLRLLYFCLQLTRENSELRDLCCFLDDGRQKTRRIAHEWQCFAKYMAAVLKNEVTEFETKLGILQVGILAILLCVLVCINE